MRFRSKIDVWLIAVLAGSGLLAVLACVPALQQEGVVALPVIAIVLLSVLAFPLWLLAQTYYEFQDDILLVRSGPFKWRVPLSQVHDVQPTRSILSSPALSLDRLRIDYGSGGCILVSPADKAGFLGEINARRSNPSVKRP